jgi:transcriptional regulator with XRE-family HTH domain
MLGVVSALESFAELDHPGGALRERRIELGWTQAELSARTGIPQADISRIENGHLDARWSTLHRLSIVLAVVDRPKRSLANGNRRSPSSARKHAKRWAPEGPRPEIS